jgi:hypothetical protein
LADTSSCVDKDVILYNPTTNADGTVSGLALTFWSGNWGTICDDVTDCDAPGGSSYTCSNGYVNVAGGQQLAAVVCRQLGYDPTGAAEYNANGGSSGYPIVVDGTSNHISGCAGDEASLSECNWLSYGSHNCGHSEDVGVTCSGVPGMPVAAGASAVGDPHLQNVHGERFDLMKPGKHVLINIPRGVSAGDALLRVQADARRLGGQCADMYFQELNVTGSWAEAKQAGGYHYSVSQPDVETPEWIAFGQVGLKVVHGRTVSGLSYLNVYVKHLARTGFAVGGLLGEDDHEDVITPPAGCDRSMSLIGLQDMS